MNFSIILPSRERPELLKSFIQSIEKTTEDFDNIEVLIALDECDKHTDYKFLEEYEYVLVFRVRRSANFSKDYYNFLASQSIGNWIICANDDSEFKTDGWDNLALGVLESRPNIVYGFIEDGMDGYRVAKYDPYCSFPLIGRKGYETLGYIFPDRIPIWGANLWVKYLYEELNSWVKLPIKIQHLTHRNKTRSIDHINEQITRKYMFVLPDPTRLEFEKLRIALEQEKAKV
jgi:glycosyltransferase involved in cell wall biosynthesis